MPVNPSTVDTTNPLTVKYWSKEVWASVGHMTHLFNPANGFVGSDKNNIIIRDDHFEANPGDEVTTPIFHALSGEHFQGNEKLWGNEHGVEFGSFKWTIDQWRNGWKLPPGRMSRQRLPFNIYKEAKDDLTRQLACLLEISAMNQLAGAKFIADATSANLLNLEGVAIDPSKTKWTGNNTVDAIDSFHMYRFATGGAGAAITTDEGVQADSTAYMDIPGLRKVRESMVTMPCLKMRPIVYKGKPYYIILVAPEVITRMKQDDTKLYAQLIASMQGGFVAENPLWVGALGEVEGFIFFETPWVPLGHHSTTFAAQANVRRNIILGAGALTYGWATIRREIEARGGKDEVESKGVLLQTDSEDWGNDPKIAWAALLGMKAVSYLPPKAFQDATNPTTTRWRYGSAVYSTYAARAVTVPVTN